MIQINIDGIVGIVFGVVAFALIIAYVIMDQVGNKKQAVQQQIQAINNQINDKKFIAENTADGKLQAACNSKVKDLEQQKQFVVYSKKFPGITQY